MAAVGAAKGTFADLDHVGAVAGHDDRAGAVLAQQRRVVGCRQHEAVRIHDRHRRIEERLAQPQALHLDAEPLSLLRFDRIVVDVLVQDHAVYRGIQIDLLRLGKVVVRLDFFDFR